MGKNWSGLNHMCGSNSFSSRRFMSKRKMTAPHLDIKQWLKSMELPHYAVLFAKYKGVEDLIYLEESDIKELGITNGAHRAKIVSSLFYLRKKYEKCSRGSANKPSNTSIPGRSSTSSKLETRSLPPLPSSASVSSLTGLKNACCGNSKGGVVKQSPVLSSTSRASSSSSHQSKMEPLVDPSASPQQLRRALEWELSLDARDLRSHAWYHGTIPRQRAEELTTEDGDFLIRDCISQPGDYVLTCRWKDSCLHFVINKVVIQPNTVYERIQFQFEDDSYDTVPDLVTFYVGSGRPISVASGAKICRPVNRSMPLTFYATKYASQCMAAYGMIGGGVSMTTTPMLATPTMECGTTSPRPSPFQSPHHTPDGSPPTPRREIPPRLPEKHVRSAGMTDGGPNRRFGMVVVDGSSNVTSGGSVDLPERSGSQSQSSGDSVSTVSTSGRRHNLSRVGSEPMLSPSMDRKRWNNGGTVRPPYGTMCVSMTHNLDSDSSEMADPADKPPPKPSRVPSILGRRKGPAMATLPAGPQPAVYYNDGLAGNGRRLVSGSEHGYEEPGRPSCPGEYHNGSDSGNGSGDSVHSSDAASGGSRDRRKRLAGGPPLPPRPINANVRRTGGGIAADGDSAAEEDILLLSLPEVDRPSTFDLSTFATMMLPKENKPLDSTALNVIHSMLLETGSRVLANHLTRVDVEVLQSNSDHDLGLGVMSGIELVTLPQGKRLRKDLMERLECLKLFVAITILTCMNETQRAELVNKWIHVAIDTKTALGNLYGFTSIMLALGLPQIQRLKTTWLTLRQRYTETAFTYETKLRPTLKAMNEGVNPQAPNTCIPHLMPLLALLEQPLIGEPAVTTTMTSTATIATSPSTNNANAWPSSTSFVWDATTSDYGIQLIHTHLESGRAFVGQCPMLRRNAEIVMEHVKFDELVLDAFRTEFHLRFLWGTKGAAVSAGERHAKFQQVLNVMSERCEASNAAGTTLQK